MPESQGMNSEEIIAVPGFGFMPQATFQEIERRAEGLLTILNISDSDISVAQKDYLKCVNVIVPDWTSLYNISPRDETEGICPPFWDNASCIPPALSGQTATLPCMTMFAGKLYDTTDNVSRHCSVDALWADKTDYSQCRPLELEMNLNITQETSEPPPDLEISIVIYLIGHLLSLLALSVSLFIFGYFRELRCMRHKVHIGLFIAFGLADLAWLSQLLCQTLLEMGVLDMISVYCISWLVIRLFHLTSFVWMFLEGLYLYLQVQFPLSLTSVRYRHFTIIGWGSPLVNIFIWAFIRYFTHAVPDPSDNSDVDASHNPEKLVILQIYECPFFAENDIDLLLYNVPVFILLSCNTFFLIWIMIIVVTKLRQRIALDHDKRNLKAAKALLILIPLLGAPYIVTLIGPDRIQSPDAYTIFQIMRAIILSSQGLVISFLYCFLNAEVQGALNVHWSRWKLVRSVGRESSFTQSSFFVSNIGLSVSSGPVCNSTGTIIGNPD